MNSVDHIVMARMTPSIESCAEAFTAQSNIASSHVRVDLKNVEMDCLRQMSDFKSMYDPEKQQDKYITKVSKGMPEQLKDPKQLPVVLKVLFDELLFSKKRAMFEPKAIVESLLLQAAAAFATLAVAAKGFDGLLLQVGLFAKAVHQIFEISRGMKYVSTDAESLTVIGELKGTLFEGSYDSYLREQLKFGNRIVPLLTYLNKVQSHAIMECDVSKTVKKKMKNAAVEDKPKEEEVEKEHKRVLRQTTTTVYGSSLVTFLSAEINNYAVLLQKGLTTQKSDLNIDTLPLNFRLSEIISDMYDAYASDAEAKVSHSLHDSKDEPKEEPKDEAFLADEDQVGLPGVLIPDINKPQTTHHQDDVGGMSVKYDKMLIQTDVGKRADGVYRDRRQMNVSHRRGMSCLRLYVLKLLAAELHLPDAAIPGEQGQEWTDEGEWPEKENDEEISNSHDDSTGLSSSRSVDRAAIHPDQVADSSYVLREEGTMAKQLLQVDLQTHHGASHGVGESLVGTELETDGMEQDVLSSSVAGQGSVSCSSPLLAGTEASPTQMASQSTSNPSNNLSACGAEKECDISASGPCQAAQNLSEQLPLLTSVESDDQQFALPLDNGLSLSEELLEIHQGANSVRPETGISTHCELMCTDSTAASKSTHIGFPCMETCSYDASSSICPSASRQDYCQTLDSQSAGHHCQSLEDQSAGYHHQASGGQSAGYHHQASEGQSAGYHHQASGDQSAGDHHQPVGGQLDGYHHQSPGGQSAGYHHQSLEDQSTGNHHQSLEDQSIGYHHQPPEGQSAGYHHQSLEDQPAGYHHQPLGGQSAGYHHQPLGGQSAGYHQQTPGRQSAGSHHQSPGGQSAGYHHQSLGGQSAGYHHQQLGGQSAGYHHQSPGGQSAGYHHQSLGGQSAGYHHQQPGGQSAGYHHQQPGGQSAGYYHQSLGGQSAGYHHPSLGGQSADYHHQPPGGQSAGYHNQPPGGQLAGYHHQSLGGQSTGYHQQTIGGQAAVYHHESFGGQSAGSHHHSLKNQSAVSICSTDTSDSIRSAESSQPTARAPTRQRIDLRRAVNRQYAHVRTRIATYGVDWQQSTGTAVRDVALSGFYLLEGEGRRVRCFYCGLELDHRSDGYNVWDEHVRYSPTCEYLLAIMGADFVHRTQIALAKQND